MCGICGKLSFSPPTPINEGLLHQMSESIRHRGPDDSGYYLNRNIGLGMRRLSIIGLKTGHQPISNENESAWVVSNGEIYNFVDLRHTLEAKNHRFRTNTDTEVIVHLYEDFGEDCVQKLRGMFAFALWDEIEQKLFLARDRIGQKPLYYAIVDGSLIFGSEIKAILQDPKINRCIDRKALDEYLTYGFIPSPKTIFKGINKLPPAHYLTCKDGKIKIKRYWDVKYNSEENMGEAFYTQRLTEILHESVKLRLVSDVPLGAFLSGGVDSSLIVAMMSSMSEQPIKTFAIGYKEHSFNELRYARIVAERFGTDHQEFEVECEVESLLPKLVWHLDEPFADSSIIPTYYVSKMARQHVTVALSGEAGDEVFGGYRRYKARRMAWYYNSLPRWVREKIVANLVEYLPESAAYYGTSIVKKLKRFVDYAAVVSQDPRTSWQPLFTNEAKAMLYNHNSKINIRDYNSKFLYDYFNAFENYSGPNRTAQDEVTQMLWVDLMTTLPEQMLNRVDRMSMAVSLEARAPLLDHKLIEFMATVPTDLKLRGLTSKYILKKSVEHLLPKEILHRSKQGFAMPMASWIKNELRSYIGDYLLSETSRSRDYFDQAYIEQIISDHQKGKYDYNRQIWALLNFEVWHRTFLNGKI